MSRVVIFGATGSLGRHVVRQAIAANHDVSVVVRTPSKLPADVRPKVIVHQCDLNATSTSDLAAMLSGHDAAINTAGQVAEGQAFVDLVDRIITGLEALSVGDRPVCWFMAGVGLLDIDGRVGEESTCLASVRHTGLIASIWSGFEMQNWTGEYFVLAPWLSSNHWV
jgi:putative NADH-flavin reductase